MSTNSYIPDFIDVANIQNLFWNNNSDLYPVCVPTGYHRIENTRPVFLSPYTGTCVLSGEFNHCVFNGQYYFLTKIEVIDITTQTYKYQLDYDVMVNFMDKGVNVTGTLIKTNRKDILRGCLQTTKAILADPIRKEVFSYALEAASDKTIGIKWYDANRVWESLKETSISTDNLNAFIYRVRNNPIARGTKNKKWKANTKEFSIHKHQNPIILLDSLPTEKTIPNWKLLVLGKLESYLKKHIGEFIIVKQSSIDGHFNNGGYAIGRRDHTIGQSVTEEVSLKTIDLSGLIDVEPVDYRNKQPVKPTETPDYTMLSRTQSGVVNPTDIYVLLRIPHLPIGNDKSYEGAIPPMDAYSLSYNEIGVWPGIDSPQKILSKSGDVGFLWYLNKNNIALIKQHNRTIARQGVKLAVSLAQDQYSKWGFFYTDYKNVAPLGFLIYQVKKSVVDWDDIEYTGQGTDSIEIRTGLHDGICDSTYINTQTDEWWQNASKQMDELWGAPLFSRINLSLDNFNWFSIVPPIDSTDYYYKYFQAHYWDYIRFFPKAGNRQQWYPSMLNRMDHEWAGKVTSNPYSYEDPNVPLPNWLLDRENRLNAISLYERHSLTKNLKKGWLLSTTLEHRWLRAKWWLRWVLPYDISDAEWGEWLSINFYRNYRPSTPEITKVPDSWTSGLIIAGGLLGLMSAVFPPAALAFTAGGLGLTATGGVGALLDTGLTDLDKASIINIVPYSTQQSDINDLSGRVVFYLYRGKYQLGIYNNTKKNISLNQTHDNLIDTVDGTTSKDLSIFTIEPLEGLQLDFKGDPLSGDNEKSRIIQAALGAHTEGNKVHNYTAEELDTDSYTFDLKGTDWYMVTHNGNVSLIPKSTVPFTKVEEEGKPIEIKRDDVSLYAQINQKAELNFYGQIFNLNTKFDFNTTFRYSSKPLIMDPKFGDSGVEYKWLSVDIPNDNISVIATLDSKTNRTTTNFDPSDLLMARERISQLAMNYEQTKFANELMMNEKRLNMVRQREDLDFQWGSAVAGTVLNSVATAAMGVAGGASGAISKGMAASMGFRASRALIPEVEFLIKYPTLMKRVDEDERNLILANAQQLYQRKQNYEHDFRFQTYALNKIAGSYQKPTASSRDVQEKFNEARKKGNVTVEIYLPSPDQQTLIDHIYNTFGCECVSDHFKDSPLTIQNHMEQGIYQFSKIGSDGIQSSIGDIQLRDILRQILENGVKFEKCNFIIDPLPQKRRKRPAPTITPNEFDTRRIPEWTRELWDTFKLKTGAKNVLSTIKTIEHYGLTEDEWNKYKDSIRTDKDTSLYEDVNNIIRNRESGSVIIIGDVPQVEDGTHSRIIRLQTLNTNLTQQLDQCRVEIGDVRTKLTTGEERLRVAENNLAQTRVQLNDVTDRMNQVKSERDNLDTEKNALEEQLQRLEEELRQCRIDHKNVVSAKDTCDAVNANEIKTLKAKINELESAIHEKQIEVDAAKTWLNASTIRADNLSAQYKKLQADLTTQTNLVTLYRNEASAVKQRNTALSNLVSTLRQENQRLKTTQPPASNAELERAKSDITNLRAQIRTLETQRDAYNRYKETMKRVMDATGCGDKMQELMVTNTILTEQKATLEARVNDLNQLISSIRQQQSGDAQPTELESLRKQKENLENQKADVERQLREVIVNKTMIEQQLNEKIAELDLIRRRPTEPTDGRIDNECSIMKALLSAPFKIDVQPTQDNLSKFIVLITKIAESIRWMRRSGLDVILLKNHTMAPIIKVLMELEEVPIVDKVEDMVGDKGWDKFVVNIDSPNINNHPDQDIRRVYDRMREVFDMQTTHMVHGVKAYLDQLYYLSFNAKKTLTKELETDRDLQHFFAHVIPGDTIPVYEQLFGSVATAIMRKRFTNEADCTNTPSMTIIDQYAKGSGLSTDGIPKTGSQAPPHLPKFSGVPLTREKRFFKQPFNWFRDALHPDVNNQSLFPPFKISTDRINNPRWGIEIWNRPYVIVDSKDHDKSLVGAIWCKVHSMDGQVYQKIYFRDIGFGDVKLMNKAIKDLWKRREEITLHPNVIASLQDPNSNRSVFIEVTGIQHQGSYQFVRRPVLGKNGKLTNHERWTTDLIKLMFILSKNRVLLDKWYSGRARADKYSVYQLLTMYTPDINQYKNLNFEGSPNEYFNLGWIVPMEYVDDIKETLGGNIQPLIEDQRAIPIYRLLSLLFAIVSDPDNADDLLDLYGWHMEFFLNRLNHYYWTRLGKPVPPSGGGDTDYFPA